MAFSNVSTGAKTAVPLCVQPCYFYGAQFIAGAAADTLTVYDSATTGANPVWSCTNTSQLVLKEPIEMRNGITITQTQASGTTTSYVFSDATA